MIYYIVEVLSMDAEEWQEIMTTDDVIQAMTEAESLYLNGYNVRVLNSSDEIIEEW